MPFGNTSLVVFMSQTDVFKNWMRVFKYQPLGDDINMEKPEDWFPLFWPTHFFKKSGFSRVASRWFKASFPSVNRVLSLATAELLSVAFRENGNTSVASATVACARSGLHTCGIAYFLNLPFDRRL